MINLLGEKQAPPRRGFLEQSFDERKGWFAARNEPPMHHRQVQRWLFQGRAVSFDKMTDLPARLRGMLAEEFVPFSTSLARQLVSTDGTRKVLLELHDRNVVECVLLPEGPRRTACISTQVGCGMGCVFCASGIGGVVHNLTTAEIVEELLQVRNLLPPGERLTHVVVMGMGEPLANLNALMPALALATSPQGLGIGARHVTISTVGLPEKIRKLADMNLQHHLAVSLHAPNDELRSRIVPVNARVGLGAILEAADYFQARTGRQVTYEYVLLRDVNDRSEHAAELAKLLKGRQAHVNLIPFNDVPGLPYRRLSREALATFQAILDEGGVSVTVRKRKGADIDAACGQLRRQGDPAGGGR